MPLSLSEPPRFERDHHTSLIGSSKHRKTRQGRANAGACKTEVQAFTTQLCNSVGVKVMPASSTNPSSSPISTSHNTASTGVTTTSSAVATASTTSGVATPASSASMDRAGSYTSVVIPVFLILWMMGMAAGPRAMFEDF